MTNQLVKYRTMASEAWAAYQFGAACPDIFLAWVADRFWEVNEGAKDYKYCKAMAEGFYYGVKLTVTGEMGFKEKWVQYCSNLQPA